MLAGSHIDVRFAPSTFRFRHAALLLQRSKHRIAPVILCEIQFTVGKSPAGTARSRSRHRLQRRFAVRELGQTRMGGYWFRINATLCDQLHRGSSQSVITSLSIGGFHMRKHISFAIAAAIVGLAVAFWVKDDVVKTNADVVGPTLYSASSMSNPY